MKAIKFNLPVAFFLGRCRNPVLHVALAYALLFPTIGFGQVKSDERGPAFNEAVLTGSRVRVSFENVGSGLITKSSRPDGDGTVAAVLSGFQLRLAKGEWMPARARIIGPNKVDLSHPEVLRPAAVRYVEDKDLERANLFNKDGLPAVGFAADQLPRVEHQWKKRKYDEAVPTPTYSKISYGEHARNVLDFWKAESNQPTPLVVVIHGGGWNAGNKEMIDKFVDTNDLLEAGISVAAINYRLMKHCRKLEPPVSGPLYDAARSIQFLRTKADQWNIDISRIAATGGSAGACSSLWVAYHDDLADPDNADPVLRESSRLACVAPSRGQTTLDPQQMKEWIPNSKYGAHAFGLKSFETFLAQRESIAPWIKEYSPYSLLTEDDPPTYMYYPIVPVGGKPEKDPTHSASFGVGLQERCQELGVTSELYYPGAPDAVHQTATDYLISQLRNER